MSSAAGAAHSLALASDGSLFTWGSGHRGQLGHGTAKEMDAAGVATVNERQCVLAPKKISRLDPSHLAAENRCVRCRMQQTRLCLVAPAVIQSDASSLNVTYWCSCTHMAIQRSY